MDETVSYRLAKKSGLWVAFTPSGHDGARTWQMEVSVRGRGGRVLAPLIAATAMRPVASVTLKGETYPLTIGWHESRRGGAVAFGGERKIGMDGGTVSWEMIWKPQDADHNGFLAEMRVRTTPRREGQLSLRLHTPLYKPELWSLPAAAARGHCAVVARSNYNKYAVSFVMLSSADDDGAWDENQNSFMTTIYSFPMGGGKPVKFALDMAETQSPQDARRMLASHYARIADTQLHPVAPLRPLFPQSTVDALLTPDAHAAIGIERLYLRAPAPDQDSFYAGFPHYSLEALQTLWNWGRIHPDDRISRLVRFGATGFATDFQVMGRSGQPEPNKGAFWDCRGKDGFSDSNGEPTHGIAANARMARALFLLHTATGEPLYKQSGLNICQWLMLKQNSEDYYSGESVHATQGELEDGKVFGNPAALDGAQAIQPMTLAYRATQNEVFIKAARRIAAYLIQEWMPQYEPISPVDIAQTILSLMALDAEAPSDKMRAIIREWGSWLRIRPLNAGSPILSADGHHSGLFECAKAGFLMHAMDSDPDYLRYAFAALGAIPRAAYFDTWRAADLYHTALLSLGSLISEARPDFDMLHLRLGWRDFAPDPATASFLKVTTLDGGPVDYLPLVCRANDQLLVIALAPPDVTEILIHKNGKQPISRDLLTDALDAATPLHPLLGEEWARVGIFTVDR